jgi:PadR family transcriptional regulator PadR
VNAHAIVRADSFRNTHRRTSVDRLVALVLVEPDREETVDGRPRRCYRLTADGATALDAETERLRASVEAATAQRSARRRFGLGPVSS